MEQTKQQQNKTLAFLFEPSGNPIWTVTENGFLSFELDPEIEDDDEVWEVLGPLQEEFNTTCFTINPNFQVLGFPSDEAMEAFNTKWKAAYEFLTEHLKGRYEVEEPIYFKDRIKDVY